MSSPHLDLIGLVVEDMAKSLAFYRLLGVPIPDDCDSEDHVEVMTGGIRLAWDTVAMIQSFSEWVQPTGSRTVVLAFKCEEPAAVDVTYERLTGLGYRSHRAPFDAFWGQRYATVLDPDGNAIDLFAALVDD